MTDHCLVCGSWGNVHDPERHGLTEADIQAGMPGQVRAAVGAAIDDARRADYIAARAAETLSYGDIAYAESQGWCPSSPDGMGPHRPDNTTDPLTCAECGAEVGPSELPEALAGFADSHRAMFREYVEGWYSPARAAAILNDWGTEA